MREKILATILLIALCVSGITSLVMRSAEARRMSSEKEPQTYDISKHHHEMY